MNSSSTEAGLKRDLRQCRHRSGWRKNREGRFVCKVCGLVRGAKEPWLLLPLEGKKRIGRRAVPNSKRTFPDRKAATVVNDTIDFHVPVMLQFDKRRRFTGLVIFKPQVKGGNR